MQETNSPIAIIMGSKSDWPTMVEAANILKEFGVQYDAKVVSAHRSAKYMIDFASQAKSAGYQCIIAGAGGAAHLPGMVASVTTLPVLGVPIKSKFLDGLDSLLSIVQMPAGVPVATFATGIAGAKNAALYALRMLAMHDDDLTRKLDDYAKQMAQKSLSVQLDEHE